MVFPFLKRPQFWSAAISIVMPWVAKSAWDIGTVRTAGGDCVVAESRLDETKLTLRFFDFGVSRPAGPAEPRTLFVQCGVTVQFVLPAGLALKNLTHRLLVYAKKDARSAVEGTGSVRVNGQAFTQRGILLRGNSFDGLLLLYKSFDVSQLSQCNAVERRFDVRADWRFQIDSDADAGPVHIDLTGDNQWVDLWMDVAPCESVRAVRGPALEHGKFRADAL